MKMTRGYILTLINNNPIRYLTNQGLTVTLTNNRLQVKPTYLVTTEIANYIKQHKDSIKNQLLGASQNVGKLPQLGQLTTQQRSWLEQIADYLQTTPNFLLEQQLIDEYDLVELLDKEPALVANTIKAGYYWVRYKQIRAFQLT